MKKILYIFCLFGMVGMFSSCGEDGLDILYDEIYVEVDAATTVTGTKIYAYDRLNDGQGVPSGFLVTLAAAHQSNAVNYSFEIDPASTAIANLHYTLDATSGSIDAGTSTDELPITILDDNIAPGEELTIIVNLTSSDVAINPNYESGTHIIGVTCEGNISAAYSYTLTDVWDGSGPYTGSGVLEGEDGEYKFSDFSFGSWTAVYGIDPPSGALILTENCGRVSFEGADNYNETWAMEEIIASGGPEWTFRWSNTYGEFGTVTLVKDDGTDWPTFRN